MQSSNSQNPYLSIVIPAYNEADRIEKTIRATYDFLETQGYLSEVIVMLNRCTDETKDIVQLLEQEFVSLRHVDLGLLSNIKNSTKGLAVKEGMLRSRGDYVLFMDADLSVPLDEIHKLLSTMKEGNSVAFGSRKIAGAQVIPQVWYRVLLGRIGNWLIQKLVLPGVLDSQCGFKLFTQESARDIFSRVTIYGWAFDIQVLVLVKKLGYSMKEVGVTWHDVAGSKISLTSYVETLKDLWFIWKNTKKLP